MEKEAGLKAGEKAVGTKVAPVISQIAGKVTGGAGAAAGAAKGAVFGAGLKAGEEAVGAVKDPGFILFILGLITFAFNEYLGNVVFALILGTVFLFYSSFFIFNRKGLVITILFWIWYIFLGGTTDPEILVNYLGPLVLIGMLVHGLFTRLSKRGTFVEGAGGELIGLIPILVFFLDLGLIPLLTKTFNLPLTSLIQNLILFTPWWAILGIFTTKKENFFISLAKIASVIYIVSILTFGIAPEAYDSYKSKIIGPEELLQAKEEIVGKLPQRENPAYSNLVCIFTEPADVQACVNRRQEASEMEYTCEKIRELEPGTGTYEDCLKEEKEKKKKAALMIAGTEDLTIKQPTAAEFKVSEYFPKTTYQARYPYPIRLEIKNPRGLSLDIDVNCFFKKGNEIISGTIEPQSFTVAKKEEVKSLICNPAGDLNGAYTLVYQANIHNMVTLSRLTRLFVGDASQKTVEEIEELKRTYTPGKQYLSQAPKEFARINFGFGEPETNPIIEHDDKPLLVSTVESVGGGRILAIRNYYLDLEKEGITAQPECLSGTGEKITLPKIKTAFAETIPLTSCFVELPDNLRAPEEEFMLKEFTATLNYDYQIEKEIRVEARILELAP